MDQLVNLIENQIRHPVDEPSKKQTAFLNYISQQNTELRQLRGNLITIVEINNQSDQEIDLIALATTLSNSISDSYYTNTLGSPLEALEASVTDNLKNIHQQFDQPLLEIKAGAVVVWGRSLIYANPTNCLMGIRREHEFFELETSPIGNQNIKHADLIIVTTTAFYSQVLSHELRENQPLDNHEFLMQINTYSKPADLNIPITSLILDIEIEKIPSEEEVIEIKFREELKSTGIPLLKKLATIFNQFTQTVFRKHSKPSPSSTVTELTNNEEPETNLYIKNTFSEKNKKPRFFLFIGMIALLGVSIFGTYQINNHNQESLQIKQSLTDIEKSLDRASELSLLDPVTARDLLLSSQKQIGEVLGSRKDYTDKVNEFSSLIAQTENRIYKRTSVEASTIQANDTIKSRYLQVSAQVENFDHEILLTPQNEWKNPIQADIYNENIYLLDPEANSIWKYVGLGDNQFLTPGTNYIKDAVNLDDAMDISIDGSIYVLSTNRVFKFSVGKTNDFNLKGYFPGLSNQSQIAVGQNNEYIYISSDSGILVFNKDGQYQKQMQPNISGSIRELLVSDDGKSLYFLVDNQWFMIQL